QRRQADQQDPRRLRRSQRDRRLPRLPRRPDDQLTMPRSEVETTMRDGTILRADVYRPTTGEGPWPVLLARSPYGRSDPCVLERLDPDRAAGRGCLVVIQDCRGRFGSDGDWTTLAHEDADGYDTIAWAARLPDA